MNLERALRADGRLDGHIVQGHVDGTGRVRALERRDDDVRFAVDCEPEFAALLVPKGSIAIDGVSLTLVQVGAAGFDVALIPHTLAVTNLGDRQPGDRVNLEADVLGKYVQKYLERIHGRRGGEHEMKTRVALGVAADGDRRVRLGAGRGRVGCGRAGREPEDLGLAAAAAGGARRSGVRGRGRARARRRSSANSARGACGRSIASAPISWSPTTPRSSGRSTRRRSPTRRACR